MGYREEIEDTAKDRLRGPIAGVYTFVWSAYHWPIFVHLFSSTAKGNETEAAAKIRVIGAILCGENGWIKFGRPAFLTVIIIISMFILKHFYFRISQFFKIIEERKKTLDQRMLSFEENFHSSFIILFSSVINHVQETIKVLRPILSRGTDAVNRFASHRKIQDSDLALESLRSAEEEIKRFSELVDRIKKLSSNVPGNSLGSQLNSLESSQKTYWILKQRARIKLGFKILFGTYNPRSEDANFLRSDN